MANITGAALRGLGLYTPVKRAVRYFTNPQIRQRQREVREDLELTRRQVGHWGAEGSQCADPKRLFGIVSFTNIPLHAKFQCLVAKAMQLRGYTPIVFTFTGCRFGHEYFRMFGIDRLVMWDQYSGLVRSGEPQAEEIVKSLLASGASVGEVKNCQFRGVNVGKHALSMTCRRRVEGRLDLADLETFELLEQQLTEAVRSVLASERFLEAYPVQKLLVRDAGYIPNGGIFESALERGIDCVVYEQGQRRGTWIQKRYSPETKGEHYFSLSSGTWEKIKREAWTPEDESRLRQEFAGRYNPESTDDTRRLQSGKVLKSPERVRAELGLDPAKKTAVIFSHIAWDAAFFFGTCLFEDFEEWLFETVRFVAAECPQVNWVVKLHPFNVFKLQRENRKEESELRLLRKLTPLPDHIRLMRADCEINTRSLFPVVDYALTVNGTVGMEFPCFGVPAIVAGTGRYNGRGFTIDPATKEEYFGLLKGLHRVPPLSREARELAGKHFLALATGRQVSLEDVAPVELKRLNEAQSDVHDNFPIAPRTLEEFKASPSMRRLGDWFAYDDEPDLMGPC